MNVKIDEWATADTGGANIEFSAATTSEEIIAFYRAVLPGEHWSMVYKDGSGKLMSWKINEYLYSQAEMTVKHQSPGISYVVMAFGADRCNI